MNKNLLTLYFEVFCVGQASNCLSVVRNSVFQLSFATLYCTKEDLSLYHTTHVYTTAAPGIERYAVNYSFTFNTIYYNRCDVLMIAAARVQCGARAPLTVDAILHNK